MNKKIIFLDIDGTLTEPGTNIPPDSALCSIKKARQNGHYVYLCSGRNMDMLKPLLKYGFDGAISCSGGYIVSGNSVIYDAPMTREQQEEAMWILKELGIFITIEGRKGSFTDSAFKEFLKQHSGEGSNSEFLRWRRAIEEELHIRPLEEYDGQPIYKIVMIAQKKEQIMRAKRILSDTFAICIQSENQHGFINAEMVPINFNKGTALRKVCNYQHMTTKDAIAFGDSMNDREMIEEAGVGICMGNGDVILKTMADDICPAVDEDGIYHAFAKYELI